MKIKYIKKYYTREVHIDTYIIRGGGVKIQQQWPLELASAPYNFSVLMGRPFINNVRVN